MLSVNSPDEIPILAERYPQVEFVPTDRDAGPIAGRKTPLIDDLLLTLARQPQSIVGIINAISAWRSAGIGPRPSGALCRRAS
ncbi:MAG: hypothetical protein WDN69_30135 [Aliidongia sp.]